MSPRSSTVGLFLLLALVVPARAERGEHEEFRNTKVLELGPFEPVLAYPAKLTLQGRTKPGYRFSEALLVRPDGSAVVVRDVDVDRETREFRVQLNLNRRKGIYRVELTARTGKSRTHSGARILLFAGVPPDHPDDPPPEDVTPDIRLPAEVLAAELFDRVNVHRRSLGLNAVEWFEPLARVAREHARDCLKLKKLDHSVNAAGTVVDRLESDYGWEPLAYYRPRDPKTRKRGAMSFFPTMVEARKGIDPVIHRWRRFAAFCVPMTSELMTHGACGIARTKGGSCYIVFSFAQLNGVTLQADAKQMLDLDRRAVKNGPEADRPARLRTLGLWRSKKSLAAARKHMGSKDPALRGAAVDVLLLADRERETRRIEKDLARIRLTYERLAKFPAKPKLADHKRLAAVLHCTYAPSLVDLAHEVEALRQAAAKAALDAALAIEGDDAARDRALADVRRHWPDTVAAESATGEAESGG